MGNGNESSAAAQDPGLPGRVFGRIVGSVVSPIVDNVDPDEVVERIDVNQLIERLDVDAVLDRIDVNGVFDRVDPDRLLERVDADALIGRVDLDALIGRVDVNEMIDRVDPDRLLARVDVNALIDRVDVNALIDRVDVNAMIDRVDPDRLLARVDVDALIGRVDADALIGRVDVNAMIDRVDPDRLLARVDVDTMIERVDVDALIERVDVNALVERTELGAIIAQSTTGVFTELVDAARTQVMMVDQAVQSVPARVLRGERREAPPSPHDDTEIGDLREMSLSDRAVALQHRYAGSVSRFLAFLVDQFLIAGLFSIGSVMFAAAFRVVIGEELDLADNPLLSILAFAVWAFIYTAASLAASGRTIGKALLGLLVVGADGGVLRARAAALRTVCFPVSFLLLGLGFLIGLVRRDRRELHDLLASTAVVYAWDASTARRREDAAGDVAGAPPFRSRTLIRDSGR